MRCSICGGHVTNQRCDDCGMIFPPENRYILHHTDDPDCPSHTEPGQKVHPVSLAMDYARHRAGHASAVHRPAAQPGYSRPSGSGKHSSQVVPLIVALFWVAFCLIISLFNIASF